MNSNRKDVMKKNMQFIIPNAKQALSIAHVLLMLTVKGEFPLKPFDPSVTEKSPLEEKFEQLAEDIPRSSTTLAINAPTKQRSMKATK